MGTSRDCKETKGYKMIFYRIKMKGKNLYSDGNSAYPQYVRWSSKGNIFTLPELTRYVRICYTNALMYNDMFSDTEIIAFDLVEKKTTFSTEKIKNRCEQEEIIRKLRGD